MKLGWFIIHTNSSQIRISSTPDRDFYPCEIFLSHIPLPALGKEKKNEQQRPQAGCMSICDAIVMLKCHHVASQRIRDFLEAFSCLSNIK